MKLVVFDCDGTLADSQHAIAAAMAEAFSLHGLSPPAREAIMNVVGLSLLEAVSLLLPEGGSGLAERIAASYREAYGVLRQRPEHQEPLFPGAREAVLTLAARDGFALGIATGKSRRGVAGLLEREGLLACFSTLQTADTHPSKPHPSMLLAAMNETGASPHETIMVGDSTFDVRMAQAAGVAFLGVSWGYHAPSLLTAAGSHALAERFDGLIPALDRLFSSLPREAAA